MRSIGLILLAEEISEQPSIDSVMWLLVVTLMKIYHEKEQAEQEKYFRRKGVQESGMELRPLFKETNRLRNGIKGVVTSEQKSHKAKFQICEKGIQEKI